MNRRSALKLLGLSAATEIRSASLAPHDVIVFSAPGAISERTADAIKQHARHVWPNHKIVVLGDGLTVQVLKHS